jgi:hypothetical protein
VRCYEHEIRGQERRRQEVQEISSMRANAYEKQGAEKQGV